MQRTPSPHLPSSFRDPSGFVFGRDGVLYRAVDASYAADYDHLMDSGLYQNLVRDRLLVPHEEVEPRLARMEREPLGPPIWRCLRPEPIEFISYPFEWCFSQLRDAALLTLDIQRRALEHGMLLKDASAYNVQFRGPHPVLIDTLSFERYEEGRPWVAYRQFCEHFLGPLALMSYVDYRLVRLLQTHIDGVPLDLTAQLLPFRTRLRLSLLLHIHMHAAGQRRLARRSVKQLGRVISRSRLEALCANLRTGVEALRWSQDTPWLRYYEESEHYSESAARRKTELVEEYLSLASPTTVWDLGANTGQYSRIAARHGSVVAFDGDAGAVERLYQRCRSRGPANLLPLVMNLASPSPALGWAHEERESLLQRGPADAVLALALVHHLRVGNNVPFAMISGFLRRAGCWVVVEYVPKDDPKVLGMLASRRDIFADYTVPVFEMAFAEHFDLVRRDAISDGGRVLYLYRGREPR